MSSLIAWSSIVLTRAIALYYLCFWFLHRGLHVPYVGFWHTVGLVIMVDILLLNKAGAKVSTVEDRVGAVIAPFFGLGLGWIIAAATELTNGF